MSAAVFSRIQDTIDPSVLTGIVALATLVEQELAQETQSHVVVVEEVAALTLEAGGKRLRPLMAAASALSVNPGADQARLVRLGACLEMIHMATLIHDDVIDGAATRRGKPTAFTIHGATASVLSGDVLLAKSMRILAHDGDLAIIRMVSEAMVEMAEGEVREVEVRNDFDITEEEHLRILRMKTAAFIEACCRTGAIVGGASQEHQDALGAFGHHIGLAFQMADDLLDFRGDQAKTGKPQATDFREGCATLPLLFLRPELTQEEQQFVRRKFGGGPTDDEVSMMSGWMEARGAYLRAAEAAEEQVRLALAALDRLPDSPYRSLLSTVSSFVVTRES